MRTAPLQYQQARDEEAEKGKVYCPALAWELSKLIPQPDLLFVHEEKAQRRPHHHLHAQADGGLQEDVNEGHALGVLQAVSLHT